NATDTARDHGHGSALQSFDAHGLSQARRLAFQYLEGCFGSIVARPKTCPASRHDQIDMFQVGVRSQFVRERFEIVVDDDLCDDVGAYRGEQFDQKFAGFIFALARCAGVANGDYYRLDFGHQFTTEDTEEETSKVKSLNIKN